MEKITVDAFRRMYIPIGWRQINIQDDFDAESVVIEVPRYYGSDNIDLSKYPMYLKTVSSGGRDDILLSSEVTEDTVSAVWTLCPPQTSYSGDLYLQLRFEGDDLKWETPPAKIEIITSLNAEPVVPTSPSAYDGWLDEMQSIADSVLSLTVSAETAEPDEEVSVEKTLNDDIFNLHFKIPKGEKGDVGTDFSTGETLYWENNTLHVKTASSVNENNSLPITSAGVFKEIGNINALLETI